MSRVEAEAALLVAEALAPLEVEGGETYDVGVPYVVGVTTPVAWLIR